MSIVPTSFYDAEDDISEASTGIAGAADDMQAAIAQAMMGIRDDTYGMVEATLINLNQLTTGIQTASELAASANAGGGFFMGGLATNINNATNNNVTINANNTSETAQAITGSVIRNMPQ
jgi:hypothetical protein